MPHEIESEGSPQPPVTIDTAVWEPGPDGHRYFIRVKTVHEVFEEIVAVVGERPAGAEEYFHVAFGPDEREWPGGLTVVFASSGASEGQYVHVEVITGESHSECLLLGKTSQGKDAAWAFARRLADLLEV